VEGEIMEKEPCPICHTPAIIYKDSINPLATAIDCDICGNFFIDELSNVFNFKQRACIYYYLTQNKQTTGNGRIIYPHFHNNLMIDDGIKPYVGRKHNYISLDSIVNIYPKDLNEKIKMCLINISYRLKYIGNFIKFDQVLANDDYYILFFVDDSFGEDTLESQFYGLIKILNEYQFIEHALLPDNASRLTLTARGWQEVNEYLKSKEKLPQAFIAMFFNSKMINVREKIKQAVNDCGYVPVLIDEKQFNEFIVPEILFEINRSRFIIADFTGNRNGVYFEAGYARGLNIPVIFSCKEKDDFENVHFDTKQMNHISGKMKTISMIV